MVTFYVDEVSPCLVDKQTGDIVETEVIQLHRKSFLSKFNARTGWYVNWSKFSPGIEIYALVLKGTVDIQGLIAIQDDVEAQAVHIAWACTAPHNNVFRTEKQKYKGVGGHLLAIAADLSRQRGFDGFIYGEAMDEKLLEYYIHSFGAQRLPAIRHPFAFMLSNIATQTLQEVYTYEWTADNL